MCLDDDDDDSFNESEKLVFCKIYGDQLIVMIRVNILVL